MAADGIREEGTLTGRVADVSFDGLSMRSENGILLSGLTRPIGPISFANVHLEIAVLANCTCSKGDNTMQPFQTGCRDYRPLSLPPGPFSPSSDRSFYSLPLPLRLVVLFSGSSASREPLAAQTGHQ